jgi:hypothetical protein
MRFAARGSGALANDFEELAWVADTLGKSAGSLAANFDKAGIAGDLVQRWQSALRFGQEFVVQVGFELQESVVDAEAIVLHTPLEQSHQFLLPREAFKDLHQLGGRRIQRVVEFCFVDLRAFFPAESFFA